MKIDLSHEEIVGVMRSLMRSLPHTPEKERPLHADLFSQFSRWHTETLPPGVVRRVGEAIDHAIGRDR